MFVKVRLDTKEDIVKFNKIASSVDTPIYIVDKKKGLKIQAQSILGMLYTVEFNDLYCECEKDISGLIEDFICYDKGSEEEKDPINLIGYYDFWEG